MHPKFFKGSQDRMEILNTVLNHLGSPDKKFKIIHIIGTNGKGSTARMIASLLESLDFRVGLFTSPHIDTIYERIQIHGKNISEADYDSAENMVRHGVEEATEIKYEDMTWFDAFFSHGHGLFCREKGGLCGHGGWDWGTYRLHQWRQRY